MEAIAEQEVISTELALIPTDKLSIAKLFVPGGLDSVIEAIRTKAAALDGDISTPKGRKEIASMARKVASSKTALDELGKNLVADLKAQTGAVDAERKRMRDTLDALRDETRRPLTEWEEKEEKRVAAHESRLSELAEIASRQPGLSKQAAEDLIDRVRSFQGFDWQEFAKRAEDSINGTLHMLYNVVSEAEVREAAEAEAARARLAEALRAQAEREQRLRDEAAAEATRKAEVEAARVAAEVERKATAERERVARETAAATERVRLAEEAASRAERLAREAEERAERDAIQAAELAKQREAAAVERERQRVEAAKQAEDEATRKREENARRRGQINRIAANAFVKQHEEEFKHPMTDEFAKWLVTVIAKNQIPNVRITY